MASERDRRSKLLLVEDHELVRAHLTALLQREPDLEVHGEAGAGATALSLLGRQEPDLVILDAASKRSRGLDLLKELKGFRPQLPVLMVSMHDETFYAERALRAGAQGFLTAEEAAAHMLAAVRKVLAGEIYVSERMAERLKRRNAGKAGAALGSPLEMLTEREWEVFQRIGSGMSTQQMAEELGLGIKTVESYCTRIREKLQLADGTELLQQASNWAQKPYEHRSQPC
jgi:DNA-binding NarL/FixJ family response regulator